MYDIANIINIFKPVYKQKLYFKFGCLFGEKALNVKDTCQTSEKIHLKMRWNVL